MTSMVAARLLLDVKRMILMLSITGVLLAGLGFVEFRQIQEGIAQAAAFQPLPEAVTTIAASAFVFYPIHAFTISRGFREIPRHSRAAAGTKSAT